MAVQVHSTDRRTSIDRIELTVLRESQAFVSRLRQHDIPVDTDFYGPGTHTWPYFQREFERALPTLLRALDQ